MTGTAVHAFRKKRRNKARARWLRYNPNPTHDEHKAFTIGFNSGFWAGREITRDTRMANREHIKELYHLIHMLEIEGREEAHIQNEIRNFVIRIIKSEGN